MDLMGNVHTPAGVEEPEVGPSTPSGVSSAPEPAMRVEIVEAQLLRLQPGDVLVFELPEGTTAEVAVRIGQALRAALDDAGHQDVPAVMAPHGSSVDVMRKDAGKPAGPPVTEPPADASWVEVVPVHSKEAWQLPEGAV